MSVFEQSKGKSTGNQAVKKVNLMLRVKGYVDTPKGKGVVGTDLDSGKETTVVLTDTGTYAKKTTRPTIENFINGKSKLQPVVPGGVIRFRDAWHMEKENLYVAAWAESYAKDKETFQAIFRKYPAAFVKVSEMIKEGESPSRWGSVFGYNPSMTMTGLDAESLRDSLWSAIHNMGEAPCFVIRAVNPKGEVAEATHWTDFYLQATTTDPRRYKTSEEIFFEVLQKMTETLAEAEAAGSGPVTLDVVPGKRTKMTKELDDPTFWGMQSVAKHCIASFGNGETLHYSVPLYLALSGDGQWANKISAYDPANDRIPVALIGGKVFTPEVQQVVNDRVNTRNQQSAQRQAANQDQAYQGASPTQQQAPQPQAPQPQAPQGGGYQQQAPQHQAPQHQAPQHQAPQHQAPQGGGHTQQQAPQENSWAQPQAQQPNQGSQRQAPPSFQEEEDDFMVPTNF